MTCLGPRGGHPIVPGSSLPRSSMRCLNNAFAQGWISPGCKSAAMLPTYPAGVFIAHRPDRSGLPSAVFGAGADRFGLPSAVRGMPAVGCLSHCAAGAAPIINTAANVSQRANMTVLLLVRRGGDDRTIRPERQASAVRRIPPQYFAAGKLERGGLKG